MSSSGVPPIFSSAPAVKAVITLILIENSQGMLSAWNDLREQYLPTLLGTMRMANPVVPIPVLWLTTAPVGDDSASVHSGPPRQYNQLPELKFSFSPDNRITSRVINRAIELMFEATTQFPGGPVNLHLIVVAASTPIEGTWGVPTTMPAQIGQSEWRLLAQKMAQHGIHCHMILPTSQDMRSMSELFLTCLELQGQSQVPPWFPTSSDYTFLLSGNPSALDSPAIQPAEKQLFYTTPRPPVHRHQSFPQDSRRASPEAPASIQVGSTPSLVSSLQKVHGLSRKKLYGTQPPRAPFVREEPVRTKYKHAPTPLSIPAGAQAFPAMEDGHVVGKSKLEQRGRRAERPPHLGDVGSSPPSPTTSLSSHPAASPIMALYPEVAAYPSTSPAASTSFSPDIMTPAPMTEASYSAAVTPIRDPSGGYFSISPSFPTPLSVAIPVPSQGPAWTQILKPATSPPPIVKSGGSQLSPRRHSQELQHGSTLQSLSAMSNKYRLDSVPTEPRIGTRGSQKVKDAGDVPFIFSAELEAATAAKLQAALQSTPSAFPQFSAFTSVNSYSTTDGALHAGDPDRRCGPTDMSYPHQPGYAMQPVQDARSAPPPANAGDGEPNRFAGSTSSSSLQGWAG